MRRELEVGFEATRRAGGFGHNLPSVNGRSVVAQSKSKGLLTPMPGFFITKTPLTKISQVWGSSRTTRSPKN